MNDFAASRNPSGRDASIAVIVVHGVADQPRGETAEALATQLALDAGAAVVRSEVPLRVEPCQPAVAYAVWQVDGWARIGQAMRKSFGHALRSDFIDPRLGGADSKIATLKNPTLAALPSSAAARNDVPLDVRFTDFLIAKAGQGREEAERKSGRQEQVIHTAARFDIGAGEGAGGRPRVSVFEMYWADLSRLSGFAPRILAELFTLLFDLVRIGGQAVSTYAVGKPEAPALLGGLGYLHRLADHLYTRLLAMLALQLVLCALVVVAAATIAPHARGVAYLGCLLTAVVAAAWVAGAPKVQSWVAGCGAGVVVFGLLVAGVRVLAQAPSPPSRWPALAGLVIGVTVLGLAAAYAWTLLYWEKRFRAVLGFGIVLGLATAACIAWGVWAHDGLHDHHGWMIGAMRAAEVMLLVQMVVWCVLAMVCTLLVATGWWIGLAAGRGPVAQACRHVIRTGRLGLFASMGAFVVFVTALWALINKPLCGMLASVNYPALWFAAPAERSDGCSWLNNRFAGGTETFALVALMLSMVIGFVVVVLAPCVAAEAKAVRFRSARAIGGWLTRGYRAMDRLLGWGSWVALAGVIVGGMLLTESLSRTFGGASWQWLDSMSSVLRAWSADLLQALVVAIAGATTGLLALGRVTAKRLKALRVPLDAALDIDVHFREFPRTAIPRVRIVERYLAVLQQVLDQGFTRIVIVAHSQGSVITADLLRYLKELPSLRAEDVERNPHERPPGADAKPDCLERLRVKLAATEIDLLTLGCPLRQLYAQRFPALYDWACDPQPQQLGVRRWVNAWGSADYVGRWLWSSGGGEPLDVGDKAYDGVVVDQADRRDVCIGATAHTHYFEADQQAVRREIAALLRAAPAVAA